MKRLFLLFLMIAGATYASAQSTSDISLSERKPVTTKLSLLTGEAKFTNHYLNTQEYTGEIQGFELSHGRFYRKSDRLSWKLTMATLRNMHRKLLGGGLSNAANTSYISTQSYDVDYAVFYNWLIKERLQFRVGGSFNVYGGFMSGDGNAVNNVIGVDFQTQIFAQAQIRYGWDFKKFGLDLYANVATPFVGAMSVDEKHESFVESMVGSDFNLREHRHFVLSSMHNLQGVNYEMGIDFALRNLNIALSFENKSRWWNAYELQNYRKYSILKLGVSVNLFAQQNRKASNRQF